MSKNNANSYLAKLRGPNIIKFLMLMPALLSRLAVIDANKIDLTGFNEQGNFEKNPNNNNFTALTSNGDIILKSGDNEVDFGMNYGDRNTLDLKSFFLTEEESFLVYEARNTNISINGTSYNLDLVDVLMARFKNKELENLGNKTQIKADNYLLSGNISAFEESGSELVPYGTIGSQFLNKLEYGKGESKDWYIKVEIENQERMLDNLTKHTFMVEDDQLRLLSKAELSKLEAKQSIKWVQAHPFQAEIFTSPPLLPLSPLTQPPETKTPDKWWDKNMPYILGFGIPSVVVFGLVAAYKYKNKSLTQADNTSQPNADHSEEEGQGGTSIVSMESPPHQDNGSNSPSSSVAQPSSPSKLTVSKVDSQERA
jgi:hypothetical protein